MANWMQTAVKHPGSLRARAKRENALTSEGKIDVKWLLGKAQDHSNPVLQKRAVLALIFRGYRKKDSTWVKEHITGLCELRALILEVRKNWMGIVDSRDVEGVYENRENLLILASVFQKYLPESAADVGRFLHSGKNYESSGQEVEASSAYFEAASLICKEFRDMPGIEDFTQQERIEISEWWVDIVQNLQEITQFSTIDTTDFGSWITGNMRGTVRLCPACNYFAAERPYPNCLHPKFEIAWWEIFKWGITFFCPHFESRGAVEPRKEENNMIMGSKEYIDHENDGMEESVMTVKERLAKRLEEDGLSVRERLEQNLLQCESVRDILVSKLEGLDEQDEEGAMEVDLGAASAALQDAIHAKYEEVFGSLDGAPEVGVINASEIFDEDTGLDGVLEVPAEFEDGSGCYLYFYPTSMESLVFLGSDPANLFEEISDGDEVDLDTAAEMFMTLVAEEEGADGEEEELDDEDVDEDAQE